MMVERPPRLSDLSALQIRRAEVIARAAEPFGVEAVKASLMCAFEESSFLIYANDGSTKRVDVPTAAKVVAATSMQYEHDRVAPQAWNSAPGTWDTTADSVGHFQQRPMYGYGSIAELMDPAESTRIFLRGSRGGRGFTKYYLDPRNTRGDIATRIQWAQGSEFGNGDNYRPNEQLADELIARFGITEQKDWLDMATKDEVKAAFAEALADFLPKIVSAILDKKVGDRDAPFWLLVNDIKTTAENQEQKLIRIEQAINELKAK